MKSKLLCDYPSIRYHQDVILPGHFETRFEWYGPVNEPVALDRPQQEDIPQMPWPLVKVADVGDGLCPGVAYYVRADVGRGFWCVYHRWRIRLRWAWQWFTARVVYTAMVWGLASVQPNQIPGWRHLGVKRKDKR